jgi:hypothetical protein
MNAALSTMSFAIADTIQIAIFAFSFGGLYMKVNSIEEKVTEVKEQQEKLETRHIRAVEKLGDALSGLALEIRSTVGDHGARLKHLEQFHERQ